MEEKQKIQELLQKVIAEEPNNLDKILNGIPMERLLTVPTKFKTNTLKSIISKMFNIK